MENVEWHQVAVPTNSYSNCSLEVSQPSPILPQGLRATSSFITQEESNRLVEFLDQKNNLWTYRGFTKRIREQRFHLNDIPPEFQWIIDRLLNCLKESQELQGNDFDKDINVPDEMIVEERYPSTFVKGEKSARLSENKFETTPKERCQVCPCCRIEENVDQDQKKCFCYVAQITLLDPCIQCMDKPVKRHADCWDIETPAHDYKFVMPPRTLFIKMGESLWNWRSRVVTFASNEKQNKGRRFDRVITIKFKKSYKQERLVEADQEEKKEDEQEDMTTCVNKPLEQLMTVIVTTSPIKSNPSTIVLEKTFETFHHGGEAFFKCPKIIVCDGCRIADHNDKVDDENSSTKAAMKKYSNAKQSLRNGIATNEQAENYAAFKAAIRQICHASEKDELSPFQNTR